MTAQDFGMHAARTIERGIGRRNLLRATAAMGATAGLLSACTPESAPPAAPAPSSGAILQPGTGTIDGDHYLKSEPDSVLWGYVPTVNSSPVLQMASGETVTIDAVSHEGILED